MHDVSKIHLLRKRKGRLPMAVEMERRLAKLHARPPGRCRAPRRKTPAEIARVAARTASLKAYWAWYHQVGHLLKCPHCGAPLPGEPRK